MPGGSLGRYIAFYDRELDEQARRRAYELAHCLHSCPQLIIEKVIPSAVTIVHNEARRIGSWLSRREHMHTLGKQELFQFAILQAADELSRRQPPPGTPLRGHLCFLGYLAHETVFKSPLSAFVGFAGLLNGQSVKTCTRLYNELGRHPKHESLKSQKKSLQAVHSAIQQLEAKLYKRFRGVFEADDTGEKLKFYPVSKEGNGAVHQFLQWLVPWSRDTGCLPDSSHEYDTCMNRRARNPYAAALGATRIHCAIHDECLRRVTKWYAPQESLPTWHLPLPQGCDNSSPDDQSWSLPNMEQWDEINERIRKEVHWKELKDRRMQTTYQPELEILVDGQLLPDVLTRERRSTPRIALPPDASYVEVRERKSGVNVAHCRLMDPEDLPGRGWRGVVRLFSGHKILFELSAKAAGNSKGPSLLLGVKLREAWSLPWQDFVGKVSRWTALQEPLAAVRWMPSALPYALSVMALALALNAKASSYSATSPELPGKQSVLGDGTELAARAQFEKNPGGSIVVCGQEWNQFIGEKSGDLRLLVRRENGRGGIVIPASDIQSCTESQTEGEGPAIRIPAELFRYLTIEDLPVIVSRWKPQ